MAAVVDSFNSNNHLQETPIQELTEINPLSDSDITQFENKLLSYEKKNIREIKEAEPEFERKFELSTQKMFAKFDVELMYIILNPDPKKNNKDPQDVLREKAKKIYSEAVQKINTKEKAINYYMKDRIEGSIHHHAVSNGLKLSDKQIDVLVQLSQSDGFYMVTANAIKASQAELRAADSIEAVNYDLAAKLGDTRLKITDALAEKFAKKVGFNFSTNWKFYNSLQEIIEPGFSLIKDGSQTPEREMFIDLVRKTKIALHDMLPQANEATGIRNINKL